MSERKTNINYIKIFILAAFIIFLGGLIFQGFMSYSNRSFLGNSFNILVISDKYVGVLGLDENDKRLSSAIVSSELASVNKENIMLQSVNFGIPIHGYIKYPNSTQAPPPGKSFFSLGNIQRVNTDIGIKTKNISFFDWLKLASITKNINEENIYIKNYRTISDLNGLFGNEDENMFRDSEISSNKTSLQIINGTNVNGLGSRIGEMYSRVGFNVVSILTEDNIDDSKIIYYDASSLDEANIIKKSFDFPIMQDVNYNLAEVTLIVGEDSELLFENLAN